jgi:hypothetical protein
MERFNNRYKRDMKQTAVAFLVEQLDGENHLTNNEIKRIIEQAKEMEKQQIIQFANEWYEDYCEASGNFKYPEDYYNETFKSQNVVMFMNTENSGIESIKITDNPDCGVKGITFKSE